MFVQVEFQLLVGSVDIPGVAYHWFFFWIILALQMGGVVHFAVFFVGVLVFDKLFSGMDSMCAILNIECIPSPVFEHF